MRRTILFLSVFLAACTGRRQPHLGFEPRDSSAAPDTAQAPAPAGTVPVRMWLGSLEGGIPVTLGLVEDDGVVRGSVTYTATQRSIPIRLLGTHDAGDGGYRLLEMSSGAAGTVTGTFTGAMQGRTFTGEWFSPKDRRRRPFRLEARDTLLSEAAAAPYRLQKDFRPGTYAYQYGSEEGPSGSLQASQRSGDRVGMTFSTQRGAPSFNLADLEADSLLLRGGWQVLYAQKDADFNCRFRARFYTDFVVVDEVGSDVDCGFGANANIDGIYVRTGK